MTKTKDFIVSDNQNISIWPILKTQFNKVFKELLGFENDLGFNNKPAPISEVRNKLKTSKSYLKVNIGLNGLTGGSMSLLYDSDTAINIEYLMLMGFSDKVDTIEESTMDANKEFTQNLIDSVRSGVNASSEDTCEFAISEFSVVEDVEGIDLGNYTSFVSLNWKDQGSDNDNIVYILMDDESLEKLNPSEEAVDSTPTEINTSAPKSSPVFKNEESNNDENSYIVQIEDCDKRKTIFKEELDNLKLILNVELKLTVRIGTKTMLLKDIVNIDIGTTLELEQLASEPLDILINGVKIAEGEVVVVEGKFGIQIVKINSKVERLSKIKFKN